MAARAKAKAESEETFEALYGALEEKARALEQGNLPLEESLKLYEEGAALAAKLREVLGAAELRIQQVQRGPAAAVELEAGEPDFADPGEFGEDAYE